MAQLNENESCGLNYSERKDSAMLALVPRFWRPSRVSVPCGHCVSTMKGDATGRATWTTRNGIGVLSIVVYIALAKSNVDLPRCNKL